MFHYNQTKEDISKCLENEVDGEKDPLLPSNAIAKRSPGIEKAIKDYSLLQQVKRVKCEKLGLKIALQEERVDLSKVFGQETAEKLNNDFTRDFKQLLDLMKDLKQRGGESGKPVLLMLGNKHNSTRTFALNSLVMSAATISGIDNLYIELDQKTLKMAVTGVKEHGADGDPDLELIKESLNPVGGSLNVYPALHVDSTEASPKNKLEKPQLWDRSLARGVRSFKQDGVLILGNDHLLNVGKSLSQDFEIESVAVAKSGLEFPKKFLEQRVVAIETELAKKADRVSMYKQLVANGVQDRKDPSLEKGFFEQEEEKLAFASNPEKVKQFEIDERVHYMSYPQIRQLVENAMKNNLP